MFLLSPNNGDAIYFLIRLFHALMDSACRATFFARSLLYFYFYTFLFFFFGFGVRNRMYIPP
jgi:hypothetical protein